MKDFQGKTAFVTGAASGIGLAMARTFLDRGMNVMMCDVEKAALEAAAHSLSNYGNRVAHVLADVSVGEGVAVPMTAKEILLVVTGRRTAGGACVAD